MLVNAFVHMFGIVRFGVNPRLSATLVVVIPLGLAKIFRTRERLLAPLVALGISISEHLLIFGHALMGVRRLERVND